MGLVRLADRIVSRWCAAAARVRLNGTRCAQAPVSGVQASPGASPTLHNHPASGTKKKKGTVRCASAFAAFGLRYNINAARTNFFTAPSSSTELMDKPPQKKEKEPK